MKLATLLWLALAAITHAAGLEFEKLLQETTAPADAAHVVTDFKFTNKSDKPVVISQSDPRCSCLKLQISGGKLRYAPGESGVVRITFEIGNYSGTVERAAGLWLDNATGTKPTVELTVRLHIPVLVNLEPKATVWQTGEKPEPKTIVIRMAEGQTIRVLKVRSDNPNYTAMVTAVEEGKQYELVVTPASTASQGMATIRIETDCSNPKQRVQQAIAMTRVPAAQAKP